MPTIQSASLYLKLYYHVNRQEQEKYLSTKSDFVFLENDYDKKMAVYCIGYWYCYHFIIKFDASDILYKNSRYRTSK